MKTLYFVLLTCLCFGCSSRTSSEQVPVQSPLAVASATKVAAPTATPIETPTAVGSTYTANGIDSKLGIVSLTDSGLGCLRILNADLKINEKFFVISAFDEPNEITTLRVKEKLARSCVDDNSDSGDDEKVISNSSYYHAELVSSEFENPDWWSTIAVVDVAVDPAIEDGIASIELNAAPPREYFRTCTSSEGAHMTVWSGKPFQGKRIWHRYFYLGYDTEPNCKKKDYEGTD